MSSLTPLDAVSPLSKVPGLACGLMLPSPDDGSARNGPTLVVSAIRV